MGRYSIRGSAAFDTRLDNDFARVIRALLESEAAPECRALVLIGGYGRGEGTPWIAGDRQEPFNDFDFVVVSDPMSRLRKNEMQSRLRLVEQNLSGELGLPVDLQLYPANLLPRAEFSLLNFEMKHGHKVVWGDPNALDSMPDYPHERIPPSEGTRLLLNRGKLLLDVRRALRAGRVLSGEERLRFAKFLLKAQLALGDCALLISGAYDLSYAVKRDRILGRLAPGVPDAGVLAERYRAAVALKEWGDYSFLADYPLEDEFESVRSYYLRFLDWYESTRAHVESTQTTPGARETCFSPDKPPLWKNAMLNAHAFGAKTFLQRAELWRSHPRIRLYRSLPLLLGDEPVDTAALARLFQASAPGRIAAEERFYQLQRRFS